MTIKVIATDMDGTFLNAQNDYNRERFARIFDTLQEKGIRFVSISGNQYYQIKSFFPGLEDKITFVGENGAYFVENGQFLKSHRLPDETVRVVLDYLTEAHLDHELVLCGEKSAYILAKSDQKTKDLFAIYYHHLKEVVSFESLPDDCFMKFSFNTPEEQTYAIIDELNKRLGNTVTAVTSGHGNIDVISKGVHKGSAMTYLLDKWGLSGDNLLAFGDGGNDIEMLRMAKYSYAMANGSDDVKKVAKFQAPSHNEGGVLEVIEHYLTF
ncbi:Cof-type HAD-IIB family hydrolase [Streptococcus merionis]|uniref:Cof-type HAD-IIB family hydrolase n=1 Tax=Streptococcus merionis TaxID=400065 RepID=UPI0026E96B5A|nr:Cof-type HAD-IIB family hydrolase [Streptococcus merionis]